MYSPHKHSYLQSRTQKVNPRIINRTVNLARLQAVTDGCDFEPPWHRLSSEQPCIPSKNIDPTRRPCAFGRWALPKLLSELHHLDSDIVLQAVRTISDLVHDPEKACDAIQLGIPDRMAELLADINPEIRERVCIALTTMAGLGDGRNACVKNKLFLTNIAILLEDVEDTIRIKAADLLEMIARSWMTADDLVAAGFIHLLLDIVYKEQEEIAAVHLETLKLLMYGEGKDQALQLGGFEIFVHLMERGTGPVRYRAAYCLMMVTSTYSGKDIAYDTAILQRLNVLLHEEDREVYAAAASAIMFCTIKSRAKIRASEIPHLASRLVELINDWRHPPVQIFSIKALTNICEHPEIRKEVLEKHIDDLVTIVVLDNEDMKGFKSVLLKVVNWAPWSNE